MEVSRTRKINATKMSVQDSQDLMSHVNDLRNDCSMSIVSTQKHSICFYSVHHTPLQPTEKRKAVLQLVKEIPATIPPLQTSVNGITQYAEIVL